MINRDFNLWPSPQSFVTQVVLDIWYNLLNFHRKTMKVIAILWLKIQTLSKLFISIIAKIPLLSSREKSTLSLWVSLSVKDSNLMYLFKIFNSFSLDSCKKSAVVVDDLIAALEFVNCQSVQAQVISKFLCNKFT